MEMDTIQTCAIIIAIFFNIKALNLQRDALHTEVFSKLAGLQVNHSYKQPEKGKGEELKRWCGLYTGILDHICFLANHRYLSHEMAKSFEIGVIEYCKFIKSVEDPSTRELLGDVISEEIKTFCRKANRADVLPD